MQHTTTNAREGEQLREHTGLRTFEPHYSAAEVYRALHCSGQTDVLSEKERARQQALEHAVAQRNGGETDDPTGSGDRRGESEVSL